MEERECIVCGDVFDGDPDEAGALEEEGWVENDFGLVCGGCSGEVDDEEDGEEEEYEGEWSER